MECRICMERAGITGTIGIVAIFRTNISFFCAATLNSPFSIPFPHVCTCVAPVLIDDLATILPRIVTNRRIVFQSKPYFFMSASVNINYKYANQIFMVLPLFKEGGGGGVATCPHVLSAELLTRTSTKVYLTVQITL